MSEDQTPKPPTFTTEQLLAAALKLLRKNGRTTTLEIKAELRAQGFFAAQDRVAKITREVAEAQNWRWEPHEGHWIYRLRNKDGR